MDTSERSHQSRESSPSRDGTVPKPPRDYADETSFEAPGGRAAGDRTYRESRASRDRFVKNLQYGRYLEVPKGRKSIFSQPRSATRRGATAAIVIAIALILAVLAIALALWLS